MSINENALNQYATGLRKKASAPDHNGEDLDPIAKRQTADAVGKLRENAAKYYAQGMKKVGSLEKSLEKTIGQNPLTSLLVAAGAGLVVGAFLNRR